MHTHHTTPRCYLVCAVKGHGLSEGSVAVAALPVSTVSSVEEQRRRVTPPRVQRSRLQRISCMHEILLT